MVMSVENAEETFLTSWTTWENAILAYSNASGHKTVGLKHALRGYRVTDSDVSDEGTISNCCKPQLFYRV